MPLAIAAASMNALLSVLLISVAMGINNDGIGYLRAAELFHTQGYVAAQAINQFPAYSLLIHFVHQLLRISYLNAAYILNIAMIAAIAYYFVKIVEHIGGNKRIQKWAIAITLLFGLLNSYRDYIIRDYPYWALYLSSVYYLLRYIDSSKMKDVLLWASGLALAMLFRVEALMFIVLVPLIFVFKQRVKALAISYVAVCAVMLALILYNHEILNIMRHYFISEMQLVWYHIHTQITQFQNHVLTSFTKPYAAIILLAGFTAYFIFKCCKGLGIIYTFAIIFSRVKTVFAFKQSHNRVLYAYVLINLMITVTYMARYSFISNRYLMPLFLVLLVWVPFCFEHIYQNWLNHKSSRVHQSLLAFVIVSLVYIAGDTVVSAHSSKVYLVKATQWITHNIPKDASLYSNNRYVLYRSDRTKQDWDQDFEKINSDHLAEYDYLALQFSHHQTLYSKVLITRKIQKKPLKTFKNKLGDEIEIYKVKHHA